MTRRGTKNGNVNEVKVGLAAAVPFLTIGYSLFHTYSLLATNYQLSDQWNKEQRNIRSKKF